MKKLGIVRFLGTNCDKDILQAASEFGLQADYLWYQDSFDINSYDALVLPGGFSYGDYLRTGALSARAKVMESVSAAAKKGIPILGICNGFQILCEAGLLPGVLLRNQGLKFIDQWENLEVKNTESPWLKSYTTGEKITLPIAHGDGRFYATNAMVKELQENEQIALTYNNNPNGSCYDIAGITNKSKNVLGLMPHPERALYEWMGQEFGRGFFQWM